MTTNQYAIIVAGGKGTRLNNATPKQFLEIAGLPVLMHTIDAFYQYSPEINLILVLPESDFSLWESLCARHNFNKNLVLQRGGESRFQSVKNGLKKIENEGLVAIHDGVRPLISRDVIAESFRLAQTYGAAVAGVPLKDSIRMADQSIISSSVVESTKSVDRSKYWLVQTPQTFRVSLIKKAYEQEEDVSFTDDASVAERAGIDVCLFKGDYQNIKITTAEDLTIAEALLTARKTSP